MAENLVFLGYTFVLLENSRQNAQDSAARFAFFYRIATSDTYTVQGMGEDMKVIFNSIADTRMPLVITNEAGELLIWKNIGISMDDRSPASILTVKEEAHRFDLETSPYVFEVPVLDPQAVGTVKKLELHYQEPIAQAGIYWRYSVAEAATVLLLGAGFVGYRNARKLQNQSELSKMA